MTPAADARSPRLVDRLTLALGDGSSAAGLTAELASARPLDERDRLETLLAIYDLHHAPLHQATAVRMQHHPVVAALKWTCETEWLAALDAATDESDPPGRTDDVDPVAAMRALAARHRLPELYKWLARSATWEQVVGFLALEGGPDAGFDDLVAVCQVGLAGAPKMELAVNYWDEMGDGSPDDVHTTLHDRLVEAIEMPAVPRSRQPTTALARTALGGLLATNRWLQPEMLGALGLIELQAGPRCRLVLQAFDRCAAPGDAYPFYRVHAEVDPRHGKDWLEKAIAPLIEDNPEWGSPILRGARWRSAVDNAFLAETARAMIPAAGERRAA